MFDDEILAWEHGPVVPEIYHKYKKNGSNGIPYDSNFDYRSLDPRTAAILEEVYQEFGQYSAWKLRNMTHQETPWKKTKKNDVISNELIKDYFIHNYVEN